MTATCRECDDDDDDDDGGDHLSNDVITCYILPTSRQRFTVFSRLLLLVATGCRLDGSGTSLPLHVLHGHVFRVHAVVVALVVRTTTSFAPTSPFTPAPTPIKVVFRIGRVAETLLRGEHVLLTRRWGRVDVLRGMS